MKKNLNESYLIARTMLSLDAERLLLGQREIQTIKILAQEIGYKTWSNTVLLDLGCSDRYIEPTCKDEGWIYQGLDYTDLNFETDPFPIKDNSVDLAVSLAVIEHIRDPDSFISEVYRCLKPGGVIYLSTPNFRLD
jgi:SAM-dependent methyltransferase